MARKRFIKDKKRGVYIGQFPPVGGWQRGRKGIRRVLCKISYLDPYDLDTAAHMLEDLYASVHQDIHNDNLLKEREHKAKKRQLTKLTVRAAANKWLDEIKLLKNIKTYNRYKSTIKHYFNCFSDHPLSQFDRSNNIDFFQYLANVAKHNGNPLSNTTQHTHMRQLQNFLTWAYDNEMIEKRFKLKKQSTPKKDMETYSIEQLKQLKSFIKKKIEVEESPREKLNLVNLYRAFMMATNTLMRIGPIDAMLLTWIDFDDKLVRIRDNPEREFINKKLKQPNKPINDELLAFLQQDIANRSPQERYYLDDGTGKPWYAQSSNVSRFASKICAECGLPKLKPFHWGMRATMITWLLNNGTNIKFVQELADHDDIQTTISYHNSRTVEQKTAVDALPKL